MRRDTHLVIKVVGRFGDQIINSYDTIYPMDLMRLKCIYSMFMFTSNETSPCRENIQNTSNNKRNAFTSPTCLTKIIVTDSKITKLLLK